jgi:catechol 2,3-dioxygenase-like lactoylglutathione lyase family enzyme
MAAVPFGLERIDHVLLLVDGMERALAFYQQVLGCRLQARMARFAMAELSAGASTVALVDVAVAEGQWARPAAAGGRNLDHLCLALGPHEEAALRRHLAAHGVEIVEEGRHGGPGDNSLSLYVRDPSGNVIELKSLP